MSYFHNFSSLQELHLEITNRCNAACPMCARNHMGGRERKEITLAEWNLDDAKKVFSEELIQLRNILFCGTHGDPAVAKDCLNIVELARSRFDATIEFYSNGSIRNKDWWSDLGKILNKKSEDDYYRKNDIGVFSIDGLADTNHLYRRKTNFEKIIENAESFIKAGGIARWDFLVFKHNEHQVEQAEVLAKKMGFKQFRIRKTSRFAYSPDGPDKHRVLNKNGEIEYYLEPPTNKGLQNKNKAKFDKVIKKSLSNELNLSKKIQCLNRTQFNRMYVNAYLKVFPCCFLSSDTYLNESKSSRDTDKKVIKKFESQFNSLNDHSWSNIIEHQWFKNDLVKSWDKDEDKLLRCVKTCSANCDPIISQSQDVKI